MKDYEGPVRGGYFASLPSWEKPPKLTGMQRDDIRRRLAEGEAAADLATEYGVSVRTIRNHR